MNATPTTQATTRRRYPTMAERIETLLTTRRFLAQPDGAYLVESAIDGEFYRTSADSCSCPDQQQRGRSCKHMGALAGLLAVLAPPSCRRCSSPVRGASDLCAACCADDLFGVA